MKVAMKVGGEYPLDTPIRIATKDEFKYFQKMGKRTGVGAYWDGTSIVIPNKYVAKDIGTIRHEGFMREWMHYHGRTIEG